MSALTEFYAETNWRNRFGIKGPFYGPRGHLGLDLKATGRQKIPALRSGTVQPYLVRSFYVGYTLSIRHALGDYDGYVHLYGPSRATPGTVVAAGEFIGEAATWGDFTGVSWAGAHLHLTHGNTPRCVFGEGVDDPTPYVRAALARLSTASSTKTPITGPTQEEDDMAIQIIKEIGPGSKGRYGVMGSKSGFSHISTPAEVSALLTGIGKSEDEAVRGVNATQFDLIASALSK